MFLGLGKILGPLGIPWRPLASQLGSPKGPERDSKEPNDIRHVGNQFYSDFRTENKYRVNPKNKINSKYQK